MDWRSTPRAWPRRAAAASRSIWRRFRSRRRRAACRRRRAARRLTTPWATAKILSCCWRRRRTAAEADRARPAAGRADHADWRVRRAGRACGRSTASGASDAARTARVTALSDDEPMNEFAFLAADEADTERLGAALAAALPPGTTVALIGTLGAGKTRLVQAVAAALGVPRDAATSPTFVLVNEYRGRAADLPLRRLPPARRGRVSGAGARGVLRVRRASRSSSGPTAWRTACRRSAWRFAAKRSGETERRFTIDARRRRRSSARVESDRELATVARRPVALSPRSVTGG